MASASDPVAGVWESRIVEKALQAWSIISLLNWLTRITRRGVWDIPTLWLLLRGSLGFLLGLSDT